MGTRVRSSRIELDGLSLGKFLNCQLERFAYSVSFLKMVPILIVDDAQEDLVFAQRVLIGNRILNPVVPLSSGKGCLNYFANNSGPVVILLDLVMKPMSGLDLMRKLENLPAAEGSVVIMLSGLADIKMIAEGYRLGARTFLIKPLVASELKQMLQGINGLTLTRQGNGFVLGMTSKTRNAFSPA